MKTLSLFLLSILTLLTPVKMLILIITLFVSIDTIYGLYFTIKKMGLKSFKSNYLFNIVIKTFFYAGSIVVLFLIDKFIFGGSLFGIEFLLSKAVTILWCYIETKSIDETSMKMGNRSIWVIAKEAIGKYKDIKKDITGLDEKKQ